MTDCKFNQDLSGNAKCVICELLKLFILYRVVNAYWLLFKGIGIDSKSYFSVTYPMEKIAFQS